MVRNVTIKLETRDVPALELRAAFQPGSVNVEKRTVDLTFTTGSRVMRGFYDRYLEELSLDPKHVRMDRLNNGAPFLADHDGQLASTRGVVVSAKVDGKVGTATVRFAKADVDPEAEKLFRNIQDGIFRNVSVGYRVHKLEKISDDAVGVPVMRATDWEPFEISAVAMGADAGAGFRSSDQTKLNPCVFETHQESRTMEPKTPGTEVPSTNTEADRATELKAAAEAATRAERERCHGIRVAVRAAKLGDAFAEKLITEGTELGAARAAVLDTLATASEAIKTEQHVRVEVGEEAKEKHGRGLTAALLSRTGAAMVKSLQFVDPKVNLDPGQYRGLSLMGVIRESLEIAGVKTRGMSNRDIVSKALTMRASGMSSTSDFPVLFENVMNKVLLGAYATQKDTWSRFCKQSTVPDFKESARYRNASLGTLDALAASGEYVNKPIPDGAKTSISISTVGNMFAITRQALINDDMGAITELLSGRARMAARSIEAEVYRQLLLNSGDGPDQEDSQPFFDATHDNVGTGAALTAASLDADRQVMRAQKDQSDVDFLDLEPRILLVAPGLEMQAQILNTAASDPGADLSGTPNGVRGMFSDIVSSPRLSGTKRYLFADPSAAAAIEVAFLEGQGNVPFLDSEDGWRVDGVELKVRHDFGVKFMDPKAAVTNAGTT